MRMYQKVEGSVRLHILKDSQHCHRVDSCDRESSLHHPFGRIFKVSPEMMEAKVAAWKMFIFSHISSANMKRRPKATIAMFKVVPTKAICRKILQRVFCLQKCQSNKLKLDREYGAKLVEELGVVELIGGVEDDGWDEDVLHQEDRQAGRIWSDRMFW